MKRKLVELMRNELLPALKKKSLPTFIFMVRDAQPQKTGHRSKEPLERYFQDPGLKWNMILRALPGLYAAKIKASLRFLGTGSNSGYYNGKKIIHNSPGLGYVLGDEGSGAYLGKKVLQYYLYKTFDREFMISFTKNTDLTAADILDSVYKKPLPNRYIASFAMFLAENRGHYMIENIIEDGLVIFFPFIWHSIRNQVKSLFFLQAVWLLGFRIF